MQPIMLIRHAESRHHVEGLTGGWTDTELTEKGIRQAQLLADRLKADLKDITCRLYCSDLKRTLQTAEMIGEALQITPEPVFELREWNIGEGTNKTREEAAKIRIPLSKPFIDWQPFPGAERFGELYDRSAAIMSRLMGEADCPLILVIHSENLNVIVQWYLGINPHEITRYESALPDFSADPASISILEDDPELNWRTIRRFNDTAHLYAEAMAEPIKLVSLLK